MPIYKEGLEYYSHFIGMTKDEKLCEIRMKYGSVGVDVWLAVLDLIYGDKGYYVKYGTEKEKIRVMWSVGNYIQGKYAPDPATVGEIIGALVECELFSGYLAERGVLSSLRIQEQYYLATVERKTVKVIPEYWILSIDEMKNLSGRSSILRQFNNQPIIADNQPIIPHSESESNSESDSIVSSKCGKQDIDNVESVENDDNDIIKKGSCRIRKTEYEMLCKKYAKEDVDFYMQKVDGYLRRNPKVNPYESQYLYLLKIMKSDGVKEAEQHSYDLDRLLEHSMNTVPKMKYKEE